MEKKDKREKNQIFFFRYYSFYLARFKTLISSCVLFLFPYTLKVIFRFLFENDRNSIVNSVFYVACSVA